MSRASHGSRAIVSHPGVYDLSNFYHNNLRAIGDDNIVFMMELIIDGNLVATFPSSTAQTM